MYRALRQTRLIRAMILLCLPLITGEQHNPPPSSPQNEQQVLPLGLGKYHTHDCLVNLLWSPMYSAKYANQPTYCHTRKLAQLPCSSTANTIHTQKHKEPIAGTTGILLCPHSKARRTSIIDIQVWCIDLPHHMIYPSYSHATQAMSLANPCTFAGMAFLTPFMALLLHQVHVHALVHALLVGHLEMQTIQNIAGMPWQAGDKEQPFCYCLLNDCFPLPTDAPGAHTSNHDDPHSSKQSLSHDCKGIYQYQPAPEPMLVQT